MKYERHTKTHICGVYVGCWYSRPNAHTQQIHTAFVYLFNHFIHPIHASADFCRPTRDFFRGRRICKIFESNRLELVQAKINTLIYIILRPIPYISSKIMDVWNADPTAVEKV